ncbi:IQ [Musa troglodytarum]|nr:IQ [Musa troglodytarum]URE18277.1 IQ [Musa troglodytarum]URE18278.1 IQ [Musa troglodytarum]URE18280.1 IQ [Musa troglodytarum]
MGKKAKWFGAMKKVFSPESKEKKKERLKKKLGSRTFKAADPCPADSLECAVPREVLPPPETHPEEDEVVEVETEQSNPAHPVALVTPAATEPVATVEAATEVIQLAATSKFPGKTREEIAAIEIQTAFRAYMARRELRAMKGLVRLKALMHGNSVKRQATTTLRSMQTLARVQSQILSRRMRLMEENQALQRQMLLKHERDLENLKMGEEWDDSLQSREQIEASLMSKQEAAVRRERALAYAFSHQWKSTSKSTNPMFLDPNNLQWGWSWLERWTAAKPWETRGTTDKELSNGRASAKSATESDACAEANPDKLSPAVARKPSTAPPTRTPRLTGKTKSASPKLGSASSIISMQSERSRRRSSETAAAASARDDESLAGSLAVRSYMAPTESARAKSRFQSSSNDDAEAPDKASMASAKKRLSLPTGDRHNAAPPAALRRKSGPPKVDVASAKDGEGPDLTTIESTGEII